MVIEKKDMTVNGMKVALTENPGEPLLLLTRLAARDMGLWDKIWEHLARYYTVANLELPAPALDKFDSPAALFRHLAQQCVDVAKELGYDKFHLFGWGGGAQAATRCLVDYPQHLHSCILMGAIHRSSERRPSEKSLELLSVMLNHGSLELYTYYWLLSGFTPDYAEKHFDDIKALVDTRLKVDKGRLDTSRLLKWIEMLYEQVATDDELEAIQVPTLLVAPAASNISDLRRLHTLIATSELAIIPGRGTFVLLEDSDSFMTAAGPFLRAAAKGETPVTKLAKENNITIIKDARRVEVVENRSEEAVVFLHGWLMSPQMWAHSMAALSGKIRCVAPWQPAHGKSTTADYDFNMDQWTDWLMDTLDSLAIKKAILVGHSMGGMLSMAATLKYPERVKGLVLVDTHDEAWDKKTNEELVRTFDLVAVAWSPDTAPQMAGALLSESFLNSQPAWTGTWANEVAKYDLQGMSNLGRAIAGREDLSKRVNEINVPVLVMHGTADQAIAINVGRGMAERIPGAQFEEIPGAGHCPPLEMPEIFTEKLVDFLRKKRFIEQAPTRSAGL